MHGFIRKSAEDINEYYSGRPGKAPLKVLKILYDVARKANPEEDNRIWHTFDELMADGFTITKVMGEWIIQDNHGHVLAEDRDPEIAILLATGKRKAENGEENAG